MKTVEDYMNVVIDVANENKSIMDRYSILKDIGMKNNSINYIIVQEFNLNSIETFNIINELISYFYKKVSFIENILKKYKDSNIPNDIFNSDIIQLEIIELFKIKNYITLLRDFNFTLESLLFSLLSYREKNNDTIKFMDDIYYVNIKDNIIIKL